MENKQTKLFSIVIPNWNGSKLLQGCLKSLRNQSCANFEIIVVDNGSSDDSVSFVEKYYPEVKILELKKNLGFAVAVNRGVKESRAELIALLNNDAEADRDWLLHIKAAAEKHSEASFFASKILDYKDHSIIDSCGDGLNWSGRAYNIGKGQRDGAKYQKSKFVFGACGAASIYKKEIFETVGYFDEDFYMYLEDVDFSLRAGLLGLRCLFVPEARVYHLGSATTGASSPFIFKYITVNRFNLIYKNFPWQKILTNCPRIILSELRFFLAALRHFFIKEYFWAIWRFIRLAPDMRQKRKNIQKSRIATLAELSRVIG
ncbi:MAG TPA: glycosyltransferase family 2 protein [Patescibacteria group bacterium]|nr:glycosyltransferase family 2 protein [Patescibacteria group bacterium]